MLNKKVFSNRWFSPSAIIAILSVLAADLGASVSVTNLFGDHMALQRDRPSAIRGQAGPGEEVTVELNGAAASTISGETGEWMLNLPPMPAGGPYARHIHGENELVFKDVLIGEVWVASGQSNMEWIVKNSVNADLDRLTVRRNSAIRYLPVKNMGGQEPQRELKGQWTVADSESVVRFSAVAYAFAECLHASLDVPIGIIENAWGASTAETWVPRDVIANDPVLASIHEKWLKIEDGYDYEAELKEWEEAVAEWEAKAAAARAAGVEEPQKPRKPREQMHTQWRPANLWNGRVLPIVPYSIRGAIWYQGEGNSGRGIEYRTLFPTLIREWRKAWGTEFPFYFVQLADFKEEKLFGLDDNWPVLREAQTYTLNTVPNTGQAVIIDIGDGKDIHPRHKEEVGRRLARWALNRDYGFADLVCRSPEFDSFTQEGDRLVVQFNYTGSGLRPFDTNGVKGFVVETESMGWLPVEGVVISPDTVELALPDTAPVTALRYAWADNPVCNLFSVEGLPATPFRTDMP